MTHKTHSMDRRSFVRLGAITTGLTMGGTALGQAVDTEEDNGGMKFRPLGKTGLKVSEISFGSYGFNNPTLLSRALDAGINFICTCADYQNGAAEEAIGKAISKISDRRDELVVFTGTNPRKSKKEILDTIDQSLKRLQTDRIEVFKAHNVDDPAALQVDDFLEAFEEAKKRILSKNDIMWIGDDGAPTIEGQGTPYIKRSGWRKLARFFGLSWSIEDVKEIKTENGYLYQAKVKIWHPAGASVEAVGVATSEDKFFTKGGRREANKGNVLMKAITVALNRGISDILGSGEVSGEETE